MTNVTIEDLLLGWLPAQRWYGAKGREVAHIDVISLGRVHADPVVEVHLVFLDYTDGGRDSYQVPLEYRSEAVETLSHVFLGELEDETGAGTDGEHGTRFVYDALHDKEVTGAWLSAIAAGDTVDDLEFHVEPGTTGIPLDAPSIVMSAEQSNTSLVFGTDAILKVFRRVSLGGNPDIEIHSALHRVGSTHIATPLGWVSGRWSDRSEQDAGGTGPGEGSLAMLQQFLSTATDGWEMAKTSVRDLYAEGDLHADEVGGDFAGESERLGQATAEVHADLARSLPTGTMSAAEVAEQADGMRRRLDEAAALVPQLAERAKPIRAAYDELAALGGDLDVQRVHGDYHLGQVLRTDTGWVLLDFEGEPARSLAERRALASPLKDIAGMLRSFDYAARHLLVTDHPHDSQREYRATEWADRNRGAFCTGYAKAAGADPRDQEVLLRALELDKAVYEVVYEARNRPTWLPIPMSGLDRLAS